MSEQDNVQRVKAIYAAFGRGDVSAILNALAEDVEWHHVGAPEVPYGKTRRGREQVAPFFAELSEGFELQQFEVREYIAQGETVVALGTWGARVKRTGAIFTSEWAMVWKFSQGKVTYYRGFEDTAAVAAACRGE